MSFYENEKFVCVLVWGGTIRVCVPVPVMVHICVRVCASACAQYMSDLGLVLRTPMAAHSGLQPQSQAM